MSAPFMANTAATKPSATPKAIPIQSRVVYSRFTERAADLIGSRPNGQYTRRSRLETGEYCAADAAVIRRIFLLRRPFSKTYSRVNGGAYRAYHCTVCYLWRNLSFCHLRPVKLYASLSGLWRKSP